MLIVTILVINQLEKCICMDIILFGISYNVEIKQQSIIETSSTECEYISLSEFSKELMFLFKIFEFINIRVKFP